MLRPARLLAGLVLLASCARAMADVEIVLTSGDALTGSSLDLQGTLYVVELANGRAITVPTEFVASILLTGKRDESAEIPESRPPRIQVILIDNRVLTALAVERHDDLFVLDVGDGDRIPIPIDLVRRVRFMDRDEGTPPEPEAAPAEIGESPRAELPGAATPSSR